MLMDHNVSAQDIPTSIFQTHSGTTQSTHLFIPIGKFSFHGNTFLYP